MRRILLFTGLLFSGISLSLYGSAQTIRGSVRDSSGRVVPYASVNLRKRSGDIIVAYTSTDAKGHYVLTIPVHVVIDSLFLEIRCVGYLIQRKEITGLNSEIDFTLAVSYNQLPSVVIRRARPILRTNGDTLSYKVSDFSSAQDRVIEDVIKRLPGIAVATDGTISYNNKPVSGVYIGGDNLVDDKYNIATRTIPQGVVDQVQVIENHQPIKVLQNKVTSDDVALNLSMKKNASLRVFGQESVGVGLPGNYYGDLNAMLFKDSYKAINDLKGNNTGYDLQQDLVSHNASSNTSRIGNDVPSALLSLGAVNDPSLSRDRFLFDNGGAVNVNNLVNLKNGLQLRVNAYYLHDAQRQDYTQQTSIYLPGDTIGYGETQHNRFNPNLFHAQVSLNVNKNKYYLNNALVVDDNRSVDYSALSTAGSLVNQVFSDNLVSFSNEFNLMKSSRSGNIFQTYSYISHLAEPERLTIGPDYNAAQFNNEVPYATLIQQVTVPTWYTNNYFSLKIPGNIVTQSFRSGFSDESQTLASNLSSLQSTGALILESDSALNHLNWNRKKIYAEAAYDIPGNKLKANLTLPITLQQINYSAMGFALDKGLTRLYFNPQLSAKYYTGVENFVTLLYSFHNETGSIEDIFPGYILKDYRTLYANNAELTLRQNQLVATGFNYRKALTLFFFSINALYNHISNNNISSSVITSEIQQRVALPYPNSTDSWTLNGSISKYSFGLHTTFSGQIQWQDNRSVQIQNGAFLPFSTTTITLGLGADTKLSEKVNFSYHVTGTQTASFSPAEVSSDRINQMQQIAAIYYNPSADLQFKLSGEHYLTVGGGNPNSAFFFADASAKYHIKKWKVDLQLDGTNILNVRNYSAVYLLANTLAASSYRLPGRIVLMKVLFDI